MAISEHLRALEDKCAHLQARNEELEALLLARDMEVAQWQNEVRRVENGRKHMIHEVEVMRERVEWSDKRAEKAISDVRLWKAQATQLRYELEFLKNTPI
jgi:peptidoglycan hydrolase CwlO-like protein